MNIVGKKLGVLGLSLLMSITSVPISTENEGTTEGTQETYAPEEINEGLENTSATQEASFDNAEDSIVENLPIVEETPEATEEPQEIETEVIPTEQPSENLVNELLQESTIEELPIEETEEPIEEGSILEEVKEYNIDEVDESLNFSSKRIIVSSENEVVEEKGEVLGSFDGMYLIQYETEEDAKEGFLKHNEEGTAEPDVTIFMAEGEEAEELDETDPGLEMTSVDNPLSTLETLTSESTIVEEPTEASIIVAMLDTGASENDNLIDRVSVISDDPSDGNGHGDKVLENILKVNKDAKVISVKVLNENGVGNVSSLVAGIEYAINNAVNVINLSLVAKSTVENSLIAQEIQKAIDAGIIVIGAAGNSDMDVKDFIPGNIEDVITVGLGTESGIYKYPSNFGDTVDYLVNEGYTSMATAKVTGLYSKLDNNIDELLDGNYIDFSYLDEEIDGGEAEVVEDELVHSAATISAERTLNTGETLSGTNTISGAGVVLGAGSGTSTISGTLTVDSSASNTRKAGITASSGSALISKGSATLNLSDLTLTNDSNNMLVINAWDNSKTNITNSTININSTYRNYAPFMLVGGSAGGASINFSGSNTISLVGGSGAGIRASSTTSKVVVESGTLTIEGNLRLYDVPITVKDGATLNVINATIDYVNITAGHYLPAIIVEGKGSIAQGLNVNGMVIYTNPKTTIANEFQVNTGVYVHPSIFDNTDYFDDVRKWKRKGTDDSTAISLSELKSLDPDELAGRWVALGYAEPIAVYDSGDRSLRFYDDISAMTFHPSSTQTVYTGWIQAEFNGEDDVPWRYAGYERVVVVDEIRPLSTAHWFDHGNSFNLTGSPIKIQFYLDELDTRFVTNMTRMFYNTYSWQGAQNGTESLEINFSTNDVTKLNFMFGGLQALKILRFPNLDLSKNPDTSGMFSNLVNLEELDIRNANFNNFSSPSNLLNSCTKLKKIIIPSNLNNGSGQTILQSSAFNNTYWIKTADRNGIALTNQQTLSIEEFRALGLSGGDALAGTWEKRKGPDDGTFAVFDSSDGSLKFYNKNTTSNFTPTSTQTVYTNFVGADINTPSEVPWHGHRGEITTVEVIDNISPIDVSYWFSNFPKLHHLDIANLNFSYAEGVASALNNVTSLRTMILPENILNLESQSTHGSIFKSSNFVPGTIWQKIADKNGNAISDPQVVTINNIKDKIANDNGDAIAGTWERASSEAPYWSNYPNIWPVNDPSNKSIAYCFANHTSAPVGGYWRVLATDDSIIEQGMSDLGFEHPEPMGSTLREALIAAMYYGYPNDPLGIQRKYGLADWEYRIITQLVVNWVSNGRTPADSDLGYWPLKYERAYQELLSQKFENIEGEYALYLYLSDGGIAQNVVSLRSLADARYGGVEIYKEARLPNGDTTFLSDVDFTIYDSQNQPVRTITTNSKGYTILDGFDETSGLEPGTYTIRETSAPQGWILSEDVYMVEIVGGQITSVGRKNNSTSGERIRFTNTQDVDNPPSAGQIRINKTDSMNSKGIGGVEFGVFDINGDLYKTIYTDANGIAETGLMDIPYGTWTLKELSAPGYQTQLDASKTITLNSDTPLGTWSLTNTPKEIPVVIEGDKAIVGGEKSLAGFTFALYDSNDNEISRTTSDATGHFVFPAMTLNGRDHLGPSGFQIKEIAGNDPDLIYDNHIEYVTITVEDPDNRTGGDLSVSVAYDADGATFTNVMNGKQVLSGLKRWYDNGSEKNRPESITVNLLDQNNEIVDTKIVTEEDNWAYSFVIDDLNTLKIQGKATSKIVSTENKIYAKTIDGKIYYANAQRGSYTWPDDYASMTWTEIPVETLSYTDYPLYRSAWTGSQGNYGYHVYRTGQSAPWWYVAQPPENNDGMPILSDYSPIETSNGILIEVNEDDLVWQSVGGNYSPTEIGIFRVYSGSGTDYSNAMRVFNGTMPGSLQLTTNVGGYEYHVEEIPVFGYTTTYEGLNVNNTRDIPPDSSLPVSIIKKDTRDGALPGATLQIYNEGDIADQDNPVIEWVSEGTEKQLNLLPGNYFLHEKEAPTGYKKAQDIPFTVTSNGQVLIDGIFTEVIEMVDQDGDKTITIDKIVDGNMGNKADIFTFYMTIDGETEEFFLRHGESKSFTIPYGTSWTARETDYSFKGYRTYVNGSILEVRTISGDGTTNETATFTNVKGQAIPTEVRFWWWAFIPFALIPLLYFGLKKKRVISR